LTDVQKLLEFKPIESISKYTWLLSSSLTFWTIFAPLVCFCECFGQVFSNSFANSQRYKNTNSKKQFQDFENSTPISNDIPLTK
jgi:hypothetical protein